MRYIVLVFMFLSLVVTANNQTLVRKGKMGNFFPSLSTSWKSLNEKTIEITLAPGVNIETVVSTLENYFKRSVIDKKGDKKIIITTEYSLEQVLNRLSVLPINKDKVTVAKKEVDPMDLLAEPGSKTAKVALIDEDKEKQKGYIIGKVIESKESFPSIKLKIRITDVSSDETGIKSGDIIETEPYLKIDNGNPDTSDEETSDNLGALFLQKNDRFDGIMKKDDTGSIKLYKVQNK
ncbi:hypothetical protein JXR93_09915 [bacterium]|nr:hypothetical protein [bacterium]